MPTFELTSPDGQKYQVDAPAGTTKEQALTKLQEHLSSAKRPAEEKPLERPLDETLGAPGTAKGPGWFSAGKGEPATVGGFAGAMTGGAAAGALTGAALPSALEAGGEALMKAPVPAPLKAVGAGAAGLGAALNLMPMGERVARGAGSGAAQGAAEEASDVFGAPKSVKLAAGMLAGGVGEVGTSFAMHEGAQMLRFASQVAGGNLSNMGYALKGMITPGKALSEAQAQNLQKTLFGDKIGGYLDNLVGSDNRIAAQVALRKADPSLNVPGLPQAAAKPSAPEVIFGGGASQLLKSKEPMTADQIKEALAQKSAAQKQNAEAVAAQALKPASEIYRDRMFEGVTKAVNSGQGFSKTPEFQGFAKSLEPMLAYKQITPKQANDLLTALKQDQKASPAIRAQYAKQVDNLIRQWGKPAEMGGQTGAAMIPAEASATVRANLQKAVNGYTEKIGLGDVETKYRNAYTQEKIAQAKDELPYFLAGFGKAKEFDTVTRNLMKDPETVKVVQDSLTTHLAQTQPKDIAKEFGKLQQQLVTAKLVEPKDLSQIRMAADAVDNAKDVGAKLTAGQRFKQILLMTVAQKAGAAGGSAAGGAVQGVLQK